MAAASWLQPCIFCRRQRYAGGLLKESPEPPRTFLKLYLAEAGWWGGRIPRRRGWRAWENRFSLPPLSRRETCPVGRLPTLPLVCFLAPYPPTPSPVGKGETKVIFMQGASPLASPGAGRDAALKVVGRGVRRGLAPGGTGRSIRVLQTRQKRLSRFCNTRHPSRHARAQAKAGTGRERRLQPIIIRSRKVLGGVGDSFKSPPAHPRIPVSPYPYPPVRHGDGGRGCRSRRSGRRRGGGRRRRRPRGQRRGGKGTGRSRPCRRG